MTRKPFTPVREDGRPRWQVVYDHIVERLNSGELRVGDVIPYGTLQTILGPGVEFRQPTLRAATELRANHQRSLANVRGVGYKVVAGMGQVAQATRQQRLAHRGLVVSHQQAATVDHRLLDREQSAMVNQLTNGLVFLANVTKQTADKVAEHEEEIALLKSAKIESSVTQRATAAQVAELNRRLDALESSSRTPGVE